MSLSAGWFGISGFSCITEPIVYINEEICYKEWAHVIMQNEKSHIFAVCMLET